MLISLFVYEESEGGEGWKVFFDGAGVLLLVARV
jgi:hypothetical protein